MSKSASFSSTAVETLSQLAARFDELIQSSPAADFEKNARRYFVSQLAKQGLVTREDFDVQVALLEKTRARLAELEARVVQLEAERQARK